MWPGKQNDNDVKISNDYISTSCTSSNNILQRYNLLAKYRMDKVASTYKIEMLVIGDQIASAYTADMIKASSPNPNLQMFFYTSM